MGCWAKKTEPVASVPCNRNKNDIEAGVIAFLFIRRGADSSLTVRCCGAPRCRGHYLIADPQRNGGTVLVVHDGGLETMNLLHKSQFSRVHRPIKLNLTDHRRGAICLRRIDVDARRKNGGPTISI